MLGGLQFRRCMGAAVLLCGCRQPNPDWQGPSGESATAPTSATSAADGTSDDPMPTGVGSGSADSNSSTGAAGCAAEELWCDGACVDPQTDSNHCGGCDMACTGQYECEAAECVCPSNRTMCGEECVNTNNNPQHCGECDNACGMDESRCGEGECQ